MQVATQEPLRRVAPRDLPPEWRQASTAHGLALIGRTWLGLGLCFAAAAAWPNPLVWALAVLGIGVLQYHLTVLSHHGLHAQLARGRRANDAITRWLLLAPIGTPLRAMRNNHLRHHAKLGDADDYDRWYYDLTLQRRDHLAGLRSWLPRMFLGGLILPTLRKLTGRALEDETGLAPPEAGARDALSRPDVLAIACVQLALGLGLWAASGLFWAWAVLWALPLVTLMSGLNSIRSCLEHAIVQEPRERLLSFVSNPLERFLVAPFQMNYHYEHHRFMSVNFRHLPAVRRACLEAADYPPGRLIASYRAHWRELGDALRAREAGAE
jgi:fatty acid desaturase